METLFLDTSFLATAASPGFLISLFIHTAALMIAAQLLEGVEIESWGAAIIVAIILAILNATIGSFLAAMTGFHVGLFGFVIDALVILMASSLMKRFNVKSFLWAFLLAIVLSFTNTVLSRLLF